MPGTKWEKSEITEDKGEEFVNPLERHGQEGSRWIDSTKAPKPADESDLRAGQRRGAVSDNQGTVTNSSAHRVRTTE